MSVLIDDGFYDARVAREIAVGERARSGNIVLSEINALRAAVDGAAARNALRATVTNTSMTTASVYWEAWRDPRTYQDDPHSLARTRMGRVVNYFTRLGYTIRRRRQGSLNLIEWIISW